MRSAKELEHYQRVRAQFESPEEAAGRKKGKELEAEAEETTLQIRGKGKAVMMDDEGHVVEYGFAHHDQHHEQRPNGAWEDVADGDEEELYGDS